MCQHFFKQDACKLIKKETLAQVFSREFYEICESTIFKEYIQATASVNAKTYINIKLSVADSEPSQTSKMKLFAKIAEESREPFFAKSSIVDV